MASHRVDWQDPFPSVCRAGAVSIGNFDGAHRGHAALMARLLQQAQRFSGPAVAVLFDPHPLTLLRPEVKLVLLTSPEDRAELLQQIGADEVVILRTTRSLLDLEADVFFETVIKDRLQARAVVEGENFSFGKNRKGNIALLKDRSQEYRMALEIVQPVTENGQEISSSRIRGLLGTGNIVDATTLLGRYYHLRGVVVTGQKRGRLLGFPTANLDAVNTVVPREGVYACRARRVDSKQIWPAAVNIGPNPTFAEETHKIEVHLIGFQGDLYGKEVRIEFVDRLRDTRPFQGVEELVAQLRNDVARAEQLIPLHSLEG